MKEEDKPKPRKKLTEKEDRKRRLLTNPKPPKMGQKQQGFRGH